MNKLLLTIIGFFLFASVANATSGFIDFGYAKTNQWEAKGTYSNLQNTEITYPTSSDGYIVLGYVTPATQVSPWADLTGWSISNSGASSTSISNNTMYQVTGSTNGNYTQAEAGSWANGGSAFTNYSFCHLIKNDVYETSTTWYAGGRVFTSGARGHSLALKTDGTYIDVCLQATSSTITKYDTTIPADTTRYKLIELYGADGTNDETVVINGTEVVTGGVNYPYAGSGYTQFPQYKLGTAPSRHIAFTKFFTTKARYFSSEATWTSTSSDAIFDAGSGNAWDRINFTAVIPATTALTVEARTALDAASLSSASYFAVTSGTTWDAGSKKRYLQTKARASSPSGILTPILQDLSAYYNTGGSAEVNTMNFFRMW